MRLHEGVLRGMLFSMDVRMVCFRLSQLAKKGLW